MINFNKDGNLSQNLNLSFREFKSIFCYNDWRSKLFEQLTEFLLTLKKYGTTNVYIVGSFVTNKKEPGDIDICWDTTGLDYNNCKKNHPEFFTNEGVESVRLISGIHIAAMFNSYSMEDLDYFQSDREDKFKGWVKISLFNLETV